MDFLKVVCVPSRRYTPEIDDLMIKGLLDRKIRLFCVVGQHAEGWEDAMDWLCVELSDLNEQLVVTTTHCDETVEEVIDFAVQFNPTTNSKLEILYI